MLPNFLSSMGPPSIIPPTEKAKIALTFQDQIITHKLKLLHKKSGNLRSGSNLCNTYMYIYIYIMYSKNNYIILCLYTAHIRVYIYICIHMLYVDLCILFCSIYTYIYTHNQLAHNGLTIVLVESQRSPPCATMKTGQKWAMYGHQSPPPVTANMMSEESFREMFCCRVGLFQ